MTVRLPCIRKIIDGLVELDAELSRLAAIGGASDAYTSVSPPLGTSRRTFNEVCRSGRISGATKEGRTWRCARGAWHAGREVRRSRPKPPALPVVEQTPDDVRVDTMLEAAGHRLARREAR